MKTILQILAVGQYNYKINDRTLKETTTRGLMVGSETVVIDPIETIHGNKVTIKCDWLQVGELGKTVAEEFTFTAHGRSTKVTGDRMIEELRKHI